MLAEFAAGHASKCVTISGEWIIEAAAS